MSLTHLEPCEQSCAVEIFTARFVYRRNEYYISECVVLFVESNIYTRSEDIEDNVLYPLST